MITARPRTKPPLLHSFSRLYRGITAPILMEAPKRATKFAANDAWGKFYRNAFGVDKMNQSLSVLTGATAGATESFVVVPFELVKIRLQDKASAGKYNGMVDVVTKIVRQEGVLAMYQGLESTLWRHILWNAGYFGCIFQVRELLPKAADKKGQMVNDIIAGSIGGTVGTILNTPLDVVKSRIQNSPRIAGTVPKYNWAFPAVGTVMKEEGFSALYKGFLPKVLRLGPVSLGPHLQSASSAFSGRYADIGITGWWHSSGRFHRCDGFLPQNTRSGIDGWAICRILSSSASVAEHTKSSGLHISATAFVIRDRYQARAESYRKKHKTMHARSCLPIQTQLRQLPFAGQYVGSMESNARTESE